MIGHSRNLLPFMVLANDVTNKESDDGLACQLGSCEGS